jgi:DeoR/GlpR family transcriptional regulator of sugar metabolism
MVEIARSTVRKEPVPESMVGGVQLDLRRIPAGARHARILQLVDSNGFILVADVAERLAVSEMTIRRDLWALEDKGLIVRTHGGAMGVGRREVFDGAEPAFSSRRRRNAASKTAIAHAAARLIGERESIGIDVGTSTLALAEEIAGRRDLAVFTNNLHAAAVLGRSNCPVHVLGGAVRGPELSVVGSNPLKQIRQYYLSKLFLGVSGATTDGFFDYSPEDTEIKRAFMAQSERVVVLCDSSKFDHRSVVKVCELGEVATLVTDAPPPGHLADALARAGTEVVIADAVPAPGAGTSA